MMESSMKDFKDIREQQHPEVRKHLKSVGKNGSVSYDHQGQKKTGKFGGLMSKGGRSYAKVHHDDHMAMVPLPQIHHK